EFRDRLAVRMANHGERFVGDREAACQQPVKKIQVLPCTRRASCPEMFFHEADTRVKEELCPECRVSGRTDPPQRAPPPPGTQPFRTKVVRRLPAAKTPVRFE